MEQIYEGGSYVWIERRILGYFEFCVSSTLESKYNRSKEIGKRGINEQMKKEEHKTKSTQN